MAIGHNSAVRGTFADFKTVKTRGVCQLIIEVPIEAADHALAVLGGVPQAKAEQWVGIAPVEAPAAAGDGITDDTAAIQAGAAIGPGQRLPEKPTADWSEAKRKMVQRSGIIRNEPAFHDYIRAGWPQVWNHPRQNDKTDPERAAYFIHAVCKVDSCRDLDPDGQSGQAFRDLYARYEAAMAGTTPEAQEQQLHRGPL